MLFDIPVLGWTWITLALTGVVSVRELAQSAAMSCLGTYTSTRVPNERVIRLFKCAIACRVLPAPIVTRSTVVSGFPSESKKSLNASSSSCAPDSELTNEGLMLSVGVGWSIWTSCFPLNWYVPCSSCESRICAFRNASSYDHLPSVKSASSENNAHV